MTGWGGFPGPLPWTSSLAPTLLVQTPYTAVSAPLWRLRAALSGGGPDMSCQGNLLFFAV